MKKAITIIALVIIAGAAGFLLAKGRPFLEYLGSPTVTLINLTGEPISDVALTPDRKAVAIVDIGKWNPPSGTDPHRAAPSR